MAGYKENGQVYGFGEFQLCCETERLLKGEKPQKIEPQLYALLLLFLQHPGQVITKHTIESHVWAGRPVTDEALRAALKKLRDVLGDDARSPRFIKTIPKQGYKWLFPLSLEKKQNNQPLKQSHSKVLFASFGVVSLLLIAFFLLSQSGEPTKTASEIAVEKLTQLSGSEIQADYNAETQRLAFVHRESRHSPQQLYVKSLDTGEVTRLSWDNANYSNSYWSMDGRRLVFMRLSQNQSSTHIAHFLPDGALSHVDAVHGQALAGKFVLGWLSSDDGLLLAENMQANKQHRIFALSLNDGLLTALSNPNVAGRGDYSAALSADGAYLAILREEVEKESTLLITSLTSGDLLAKVELPFYPSRLIWSDDNHTVAMSSFFGEHWRYDIQAKTLDSLPTFPDNGIDLFSSCGEKCYVLRQHNGNFLDLQERPLQSLFQSKNDRIALSPGRLIKRADAQDFPQYLTHSDGLFYVTLQGKHFVFQTLQNGHKQTTVAQLDRNALLSTASLSPDDTQLVGSANGRLFHLSVSLEDSPVKDVNFITSALERYDNPVWSEDNKHVYTMRLTGNVPSIIQLNVQTAEQNNIVEGYMSFSPLPSQPDYAVAISSDLEAHLLTYENEQWRFERVLGKVQSANPHRWQITEETFYFTQHKMPEAFLCQIPLWRSEPTEPACSSIGDNRFRLNFDIHPDKDAIMLVESLSAESDIIKLTW